VPLVGENRVIARLGLDLLSRGPHRVGLRALLDVSGLAGKTIDSYHISFLLAPRVNAAGRMSTPDIAARLLLASDEAMGDEARELALRLDGENVRRQEEEAGIVLSVEGDLAHGSCRSIPRFDMLSALERCAPLMTRFGGHRQAAGLTIEASRIRALRLAVNEIADETLGPEDLAPRLLIDGGLTFRGITGGVAGDVAALAPFGAGNPRPVFAARGVEIVDGPRKLKERHLRMALRQDGRIFRAIAWRAAERHDDIAAHRAALDVAFSLEQNQYNGETYVELTLADIRKSEDVRM
jgi:single-stranded-DNA-specific exonuclease